MLNAIVGELEKMLYEDSEVTAGKFFNLSEELTTVVDKMMPSEEATHLASLVNLVYVTAPNLDIAKLNTTTEEVENAYHFEFSEKRTCREDLIHNLFRLGYLTSAAFDDMLERELKEEMLANFLVEPSYDLVIVARWGKLMGVSGVLHLMMLCSVVELTSAEY